MHVGEEPRLYHTPVRASCLPTCDLRRRIHPRQAKFDELKDAEGCITKEQLVAAMPTEEATPGI